MLRHHDLTIARCRKFVDAFRPLAYEDSRPIEGLTVCSTSERIPYAQAVKGKYRPTKEGAEFGPLWSTHWVKINTKIPGEWRGREVMLHFDCTAEALVWRDGKPVQGITNTDWMVPGFGPVRSYYGVTGKARGGEAVNLHVEMACNAGILGLVNLLIQHNDQDRKRPFTLRSARLCVFNRKAWKLWVRLDTLVKLAEAHTPARAQALMAANSMVNACEPENPATWDAALDIADAFFAREPGGELFHVSAIGHTHVDTAWLWPIEETKRKCARTFSSMMRLMEQHPDFKFVASQAQQLAWMRDLYPELYKEIKAKVKKGQFIPVGGSWVEPDCNIPSGESLVRQFLFGQRFFQKEFGVTCHEFWQPDVFGYSAALPQIMKLADIRYFLTAKLTWNQFNTPVSSTFLWEGLDGTQILTHFPPAETYNGIMDAGEVYNSFARYKDMERGKESYYLFGIGDGGGGPTETMIEKYRLLSKTPGMPSLKIRTPTEFFTRCEKDIKDPLVWVGELYFERHRGTYTTHAANKRDNRRCEELLHSVELFAAVAHTLNHKPYPHAAINGIWEQVLTNQFHDIIPGSSITEVYDDTRREYPDLLSRGQGLLADALEAAAPKPADGGKNLLVLNSLSFDRREVVDLEGTPVSVAAPSMGFAVQTAGGSSDSVSVLDGDGTYVLENAQVRAILDEAGRLVSFFDKRHQRETIKPGALGNQIVLFDDNPERDDAWDVDVYHAEKRRDIDAAVSVRIASAHALKSSIEFRYQLSAGKPDSTMSVLVSLSADACRLDFDCRVNWHESHKFLKVEFPFDLRSDYATYEVQFGHLRRPTHVNTSWDWARFEVSAHRWADLSESNFGVALLNDSKYGYACRGNVMRLSLLRAPKEPDPIADMGAHHFSYALYPHAGGPQAGGVVQAAAAFNQPLQVRRTRVEVGGNSFFAIDNPALVVDTVKKAEDSDALIVRLYESSGARQTGRLRSSLPVRSAAVVNILERETGTASWDDGLNVTLQPFEVRSYRLECGRKRQEGAHK